MFKSKDLSISIPNTWKSSRNRDSTRTRQELQHKQLRRFHEPKVKSRVISSRISPTSFQTTVSDKKSAQKRTVSEYEARTSYSFQKSSSLSSSSHSHSFSFEHSSLSSTLTLRMRRAIWVAGSSNIHRESGTTLCSSQHNPIKITLCSRKKARIKCKQEIISNSSPFHHRKSIRRFSPNQTQAGYFLNANQNVLTEAGQCSTRQFSNNTAKLRRVVISSFHLATPCYQRIPFERRLNTVVLKNNQKLRSQIFFFENPRYDSARPFNRDNDKNCTKEAFLVDHLLSLRVPSTSSVYLCKEGLSRVAFRKVSSARNKKFSSDTNDQFFDQSDDSASSQSLVKKSNRNYTIATRQMQTVSTPNTWVRDRVVNVVTSSSVIGDPELSGAAVQPQCENFQTIVRIGNDGLPFSTGRKTSLDNHFVQFSWPGMDSNDAGFQPFAEEFILNKVMLGKGCTAEMIENSSQVLRADANSRKNTFTSSNVDVKGASLSNRRLPNGRILHDGPHKNLFIALPRSLNQASDMCSESLWGRSRLNLQQHPLLSGRDRRAFVDGSIVHSCELYPTMLASRGITAPSNCGSGESLNHSTVDASENRYTNYSNGSSNAVSSCENEFSTRFSCPTTVLRKLELFSAVEIISGLFLGASLDSANLEALLYHKISLIINISHECHIDPDLQHNEHGIRILRFPVVDHSDEMISPLFVPVTRIIHEQLHRREVFLLHKSSKESYRKANSKVEKLCPYCKLVMETSAQEALMEEKYGDDTTRHRDRPHPLMSSFAQNGTRDHAVDTTTRDPCNPFHDLLSLHDERCCASYRIKNIMMATPKGAVGKSSYSLPFRASDIRNSFHSFPDRVSQNQTEQYIEADSLIRDCPFELDDLDEKNCGGVLVHCRMGVSRSASILLAYLILYGTTIASLSDEDAMLSSSFRREFIKRLFIDGAQNERKLTESVGGIVVTPFKAFLVEKHDGKRHLSTSKSIRCAKNNHVANSFRRPQEINALSGHLSTSPHCLYQFLPPASEQFTPHHLSSARSICEVTSSLRGKVSTLGMKPFNRKCSCPADCDFRNHTNTSKETVLVSSLNSFRDISIDSGKLLTPRAIAALSCWPCFQRRLGLYSRVRAPEMEKSSLQGVFSDFASCSTPSLSQRQLDTMHARAWSPPFHATLPRQAFKHPTVFKPALSSRPAPRAQKCYSKSVTAIASTKVIPIDTTFDRPFSSFKEHTHAEHKDRHAVIKAQLDETIPLSNTLRDQKKNTESEGASLIASERLSERATDRSYTSNAHLNFKNKTVLKKTLAISTDASTSYSDEEYNFEHCPSRSRDSALHSCHLKRSPNASKYYLSKMLSTRTRLSTPDLHLPLVDDKFISGLEIKPCMSYQEAFDFLKSKKKEVNPNIGFVLALRELANGHDFSCSSSL